MVKSENEDNKSGSSESADSEGGTHSIAMEYPSLLDQYRTAALAFDSELDRLIDTDKTIDKAALASIVMKRSALEKAEKTLALCVVVQMQGKNVKAQQQELELERRNIIELRKIRGEKEKKLKEKIQDLGKEDTLAQFLLPGRWLDDYKVRQVKDVVTLVKEVVKLDKVIESRLSKLPPAERETLEAESKEILNEVSKVAVAAKVVAKPETKVATPEAKSNVQIKAQVVLGKKLEATKPQDTKTMQVEKDTQGGKKEGIEEKLTTKLEYNTSSTGVIKPAPTPEEAKTIAEKEKAKKAKESGGQFQHEKKSQQGS